MRVALVNPRWRFEGSIYFGCREAHLPLEYAYSEALLQQQGHETLILDGLMDDLETPSMRQQLQSFKPDMTVITTAPSYLFWRCAPPEMRIPIKLRNELEGVTGRLVVVGPHASTTPGAALRKLRADAVVLGECEEVLCSLAGDWNAEHPSVLKATESPSSRKRPHSSDMAALPALRWQREYLAKHKHHHHRFDREPSGPGAEMEVSRGCPYHCTFCAKDNFRNQYRRRTLDVILNELDGLIDAGATYVYFIDEIFLPWAELLEAVKQRNIEFGIQTRVDLWPEKMLVLLGEAGCVSIEAGVESITEHGREWLDKKCKLTTQQLSDRLIFAKTQVPFVQANLIEMRSDPPEEVESFRRTLIESGVWSNEPVPLFPYPGSPDYRRLFGPEDDDAWERAHHAYLDQFSTFSDIQEQQPQELVQLECAKPVSDGR